MRRARGELGLAVSVAVALSGCLGAPLDPAADLPDGHDQHHGGPSAPTVDLGPPDIRLDAHAGMPEGELDFHPGLLEVPIGRVVEVRVENAGGLPHTFTIHALDADTGVLEPGEARSLTFRADKPGVFEIMCDLPGHYQGGMRAELEVVA